MIEDGRIAGAVVTYQDVTERKRVERALRLSEEKYRSISESVSTSIISADKDGLIIDWNSRAQQILGYVPDEIICHSLEEIVHYRIRMLISFAFYVLQYRPQFVIA